MGGETSSSVSIRDLFHFGSADIASLADDRLKWRWGETLTPTLRWLATAKSHAVYAVLMDYGSRHEYTLSGEYVTAVERCPTDSTEATVMPRLLQHEPDVGRDILLAYAGHPDQVYVVNWGVFCAHWDDFCYPSDDVIICPLTEEWVLYFCHEEAFMWGRPIRKAIGRS